MGWKEELLSLRRLASVWNQSLAFVQLLLLTNLVCSGQILRWWNLARAPEDQHGDPRPCWRNTHGARFRWDVCEGTALSCWSACPTWRGMFRRNLGGMFGFRGWNLWVQKGCEISWPREVAPPCAWRISGMENAPQGLIQRNTKRKQDFSP